MPAAYRPPPWLIGGGHIESIYPKFIRQTQLALRRELWPDSTALTQVAYDFIDASCKHAPLVVLFHGLEGHSGSHYAQALMTHVQKRQWHGVVVHYRGCGGVVNHSDKVYHSGDSAECAWVLQTLRERFTESPIFAVGVSLGGNVLAKYLGEQGRDALPDKAAVVSAPLDLVSASAALERGLSRRLYAPYFLRTLLPKIQHEAVHFGNKRPGINWHNLMQSRSLKDFDEHYTAPIHGFANADEYYRLSSAKPLLKAIDKPTLIINARNDPFMSAAALPQASDVGSKVVLYQPKHGGHVGFVGGAFPGHLDWLPQTILDFFSE